MYGIFPVRRSQADWMQAEGQVFGTWSIINPNGPTLNSIGICNAGDESQMAVFWRWMHFTGGESYVLGYFDATSDDAFDQTVRVLRHAISADRRAFRRFPLVTCIPDLVTDLGDDQDDGLTRELVVSSPAFRDADWGEQIYYLNKYGSDWFGRAAEQTRAAIESLRRAEDLTEAQREFIAYTDATRGHLPAYRDWQPGSFASASISEAAVAHWQAVTRSEEYVQSSLIQIAQTWVGASITAARSGVEVVESFDDVREFLDAFGHPLWPAELTTAFVLDRLR